MKTSTRLATHPASFNRRRLMASCLGLGLLAGCGGGDDSDESQARPLNYAPLGNGRMGNPYDAVELYAYGAPPFDKPVFYTLRTAFLFDLFWKQAIQSRNASGLPEVPEVDFTRQMVAAVYLGARRNSCYDVRIMDVRRQGDQVVVRYQERMPSLFSGGGCAQTEVYPSRLIVIDHEPAIMSFEQGPVIVD